MFACASMCRLIVQVTESDVFERDGFNVHSTVDVSFTQAVLGGEVKISGLNGPIMLKVNTLIVHALIVN